MSRDSKDRVRFYSTPPELKEHFKNEAAYLKHTQDEFGSAILQNTLRNSSRLNRLQNSLMLNWQKNLTFLLTKCLDTWYPKDMRVRKQFC